MSNLKGKRVFWHSSAHVLGEAAERHFGCKLCVGPPTDEGFFYEMSMPDHTVVPGDYKSLETIAKSAIKEKQPFVRLEVDKENLLKMFAYTDYKKYMINTKIPDGQKTTVYRCGPMIDLCVGPHVPHTGRIKAFAVTKSSSSYWLGDAANESLQRIYGISFPDTKQLKEWQEFQAEAAKNDHRLIGQNQELFFFHPLSPGSCFFLPRGARIYNALMDMIKEQYRIRGFEEVISPNIYNVKLWEQSGHWQNYEENMFSFDIDKEKFALKPMNCPGHCLMFANRERSWRELPLRFADFGVLHRNEASGALTGLTRVRRFQQDDAHIFCTVGQIKDEIKGCFDFLEYVYGIFGFSFRMKLSTRPEKYVGELTTWNEAERMLEECLTEWGGSWSLNPGDGAFYGPKIDITISDALRRQFQCGTIQLDFQNPERFNLRYQTKVDASSEALNSGLGGDFQRPVMIHRAILGSLERSFALLTESCGGKWPFWISPRQIMVIPVTGIVYGYAEEIRKIFHDRGFYCDVDLGSETMIKKIRNAQMSQYNFTFGNEFPSLIIIIIFSIIILTVYSGWS